MRKWVKILILSLLLAGVVVICVVRWQAWFGMPAEPRWNGDTITYTFPTFNGDSVQGFVRTSEGWQDTHTPASLDILVLGDVHNALRCADYDTLAARVPDADAVVQIGDWLDRGYYYHYQLLLREWTPSALEGLPVITCPGNHEYSKGLHKTLAPEWQNWFPQPVDTTLAVDGAFYTVDFPQVRFIVIDTNPLDHIVYLTRTLTWLNTAMKGAGDRFTVVLMHHPVLTAAKGRINPFLYATFRHALGQADLVIAGHDHSSLRQSPFVVINTAGNPKKQNKRSVEFASEEPLYGVIHCQEEEMTWRTYRMSDGSPIDSLYVTHD